MSKPFQISIRRTLAAVALLCFAIALFMKANQYYHDVVLEDGTGQDIYKGIQLAGFLMVGIGIGTILRRMFLCVSAVIVIELIWAMFPVVN
jgi:hypothetical protein